MSENPLEQEKRLEEELEALERELEALNAEDPPRRPLTQEAPAEARPAQIAAETETKDIRPDAPATAGAQSGETRPGYREDLLFQTQTKGESMAESIRQSGLAYAAGIALFGSVVFLLMLGWFADLLLGTSPWGVICGVILGSIIGFFQVFRITSQIFKDKK